MKSILRFVVPCVVAAFGCDGSLLAAVQSDGDTAKKTEINAESLERISSDLSYLSSDRLEGRGTSTQGINVAADFIAQRWTDLGLKTDWFQGKPFQHFPIRGPMEVGESTKNRLQFQWPADSNDKETGSSKPPSDSAEMNEVVGVVGVDFTSVSLGTNGQFDGPLVFAGYAISALDESKGLHYDDFEGMDVVGKVIIVLRKEPQLDKEDSPFDGVQTSQYAYFATKAANAAVHGAKGMILVNDVGTAEASGDALPAAGGAGSSFASTGLPVVFAKRELIDSILKRSVQTSLAELEKAIDSDLKPRSVELKNWRAIGETQTVESQVDVKNVLACLPGVGELADEYVVVGAHYDHVGMGGEGSLAPGTIEVHNGADDNGSGTTCLLEVSKRLVDLAPAPRRTIVFMAFSAEEKGLLGSQYYCRNPRFPLEDTVAMVNMDMVGRMLDNQLTVYGTATAKEFSGLVDELNRKYQFEIEKIGAGLGPSDHASFFEKGIPVFHFFTGLHEDYHRPSDDFGKINLTGMVQITDMVTDIVVHLATRPERPTFVNTGGSAEVKAQVPRRPRMQVLTASNAIRALVERVEPNGAAEKAGIRAGDIIVKLGEFDVGTPESLIKSLEKFSPGDRIRVVVLRDGETVSMMIELVK